MFVLEFEQVEVDWCPGCAGVWLDSGELELIGARAGVLHAKLLAALEAGEGKRGAGKRRPCPVCGKPLAQVTARTSPPIVLDRCPKEHGVWFDRGELPAVVEAAGAAKDNVLARFLAELGGQQGAPAGL
jgi:hypothetical protein